MGGTIENRHVFRFLDRFSMFSVILPSSILRFIHASLLHQLRLAATAGRWVNVKHVTWGQIQIWTAFFSCKWRLHRWKSVISKIDSIDISMWSSPLSSKIQISTLAAATFLLWHRFRVQTSQKLVSEDWMKDVSGGDGSCLANGIPCLSMKWIIQSVYVQVNVIRHRHSAAQQTDDLLSQSFG